ncbi:hypothetical protein V6N12_011586 [Hibiscus sabdariffa]|uniref:Uncharacterized protein n=1 Tax=Hibiscus sabdariffa TaxID=183260 RepID=A0ABR2B0K9_9ROSI
MAEPTWNSVSGRRKDEANFTTASSRNAKILYRNTAKRHRVKDKTCHLGWRSMSIYILRDAAAEPGF